MKKAFAIVLFILCVSVMQGQKAGLIIYGQLKDANTGENLVNATIKLIRAKDSVILSQTITNKKGFNINLTSEGRFLLHPSYVGYRDTTYAISIGPNDSIYNAGILMIKKNEIELMEVVVKYTIPPVITQNDTVVYNAGAFKTSRNATVEELLKKLPGVEVDKDGNITFQGETITKIYLDGKEFFFNDLKLATRNFLADMLQKVEVFDEKSDRSKLTSIPDEKPAKALNLRLKPDRKKSYFGNIESSYASHNKGNLSPSVNYIKGDEFGRIGASHINTGSNRVNTQTKNISLAYQNSLLNNWTLSLSYEGNITKSNSWTYNDRQTFISDTSLSQNKETTIATHNNSHYINMRTSYKPDSLNTIDLTSSLEWQYAENNTRNIANSYIENDNYFKSINSAFAFNKTTPHRWNGNINVNFNHRFKKKGRFIGLYLSNTNNKQNGDGSLLSQIDFFNPLNVVIDNLERNYQFNESSKGITLGLGINYTEPIGKNQILDFYFTRNYTSSKNNRQSYDFNPITLNYDKPDSIASNNFENNQEEQNFGIGYNNFKSTKFRYQAGIAMSIGKQQNITQTGNHTNLIQQTTNIFPRASLLYLISKQRTIRLGYNGRSRRPRIAELQPISDLTNPLLILIGNPSLKPEFYNEVFVEYKNLNSKKMNPFSLRISFRNTLNRIVSSIVTNSQGIQEQQYVNMNGNYGIMGSINHDLPLSKVLNLKINSSISFTRDANTINKILNIRNSTSYSNRIGFNYRLGEKLFATVVGSISLNSTQYIMQTIRKNNFIFHQYSAVASYELPKQFVAYTDLNLSYNNIREIPKANNSKEWNASIMKRMFKNKNGELKLSVYDILNNKKNINQNIGSNYIETTRTEVIKRNFTVTFIYRFRGNKL